MKLLGMKECVWLVSFSFELCFAENEAGCCGDIEVHGHCSKCCLNYYNSGGLCKVCPIGFYGDKCLTDCVHPWYGELCGLRCDCSKDDCHPALGCQNEGFVASSTRYLQERTSYKTQKYLERTTNSRKITIETTIRSFEKQTNATIGRKVTPIYENTPTSVVHGKDLNSTDTLWLVSVVKILGYTLGVSLLVILGLVFLFICKRRREGISGKSLNILQQNEQEMRLFNESCQQNIDRLTDISRNSINNSSLYQGLSQISHLRRPDDKGRKGSDSKSTNTYMEPVSRPEGDTRTSVDNPSYIDVTLTDGVQS